MEHNLKTEDGRRAALDALKSEFLQSLRGILTLSLSPDAGVDLHRNSARIFVEDKKGRTLFGSEVELYAENDCFGKKEEASINYPTSGSFSPEDKASYWRTIHAASILQNWVPVFDVLNQYCNRRRDLEKQIRTINNVENVHF